MVAHANPPVDAIALEVLLRMMVERFGHGAVCEELAFELDDIASAAKGNDPDPEDEERHGQYVQSLLVAAEALRAKLQETDVLGTTFVIYGPSEPIREIVHAMAEALVTRFGISLLRLDTEKGKGGEPVMLLGFGVDEEDARLRLGEYIDMEHELAD